MTESESANVQALVSHLEKMSETAGISKNQMAILTGEARVGGGWDFIVKLGADGSATWRGQTIESEASDRAKDYAESHQVGEFWSRVAEASRRYSTATADSELASLEESLGANLTRMRRFEERAGLSFREAHLDVRRGRFRAREGPRGRAGYGARRRSDRSRSTGQDRSTAPEIEQSHAPNTGDRDLRL